MRLISQLLLTFLLNACWQIAFITAAVALCAWLLRGAAIRYQHLLWVSTLVLSLCLPLATARSFCANCFFRASRSKGAALVTVASPIDLPDLKQTSALTLSQTKTPPLR